jgi:hypothetical protein
MKKVQKLANEIREWADQNLGSTCITDAIYDICHEHAPIEKPFPKHMVTNEDSIDCYIVYFIKPREGYFITEGGGGTVGEYWKKFNMPYFKDCEIQVKP